MINTSIIKLFPCLLLKEDEEEEHTEGDRDNVHSFTQEPELFPSTANIARSCRSM